MSRKTKNIHLYGQSRVEQGPALNNKYRLIDGKWVYAPKTKEERQQEKEKANGS